MFRGKRTPKIMASIVKAEELIKSGVPLHTACKQAGTTPVTFEKYSGWEFMEKVKREKGFAR